MPISNRVRTSDYLQAFHSRSDEQPRAIYSYFARMIADTRGFRKRDNHCFQYTIQPYSGFIGKDKINGETLHGSYWSYFRPTLSNPYGPLTSTIELMSETLDWNKLSSSSQFGIIQLIAELDETLAIFSLKFIKSLSYGSFTWGILPFVSELKALISAINNFTNSLTAELAPYEDSSTKHVVLPFQVGSTWHEVAADLNVRLSGNVDMDDLNLGSKLLDFVGFHPDLATAWDLIPLSFILDYFIPIGNMLDALFPKGWVRAVSFAGRRTVKFSATCRAISSLQYSNFQCISHVKLYHRAPFMGVLVVKPSNPLDEFERPTFTELFNVLYVFAGLKKVF